MKNYLIYPTKYMNITQTYNENTSHSKNSSGTPKDYPIDEADRDSARSYFYCPCDEIEIKRIYGVGSTGTNTIWLQSTTPVVTPTFTDFVTIMIIHPNDDTLGHLRVGQKFSRKEPMFLEGNDGNATGYHFHISVARGKYKSNGWVKNDQNAWVLVSEGKTEKPGNCFYIDKTFTNIISNHNLNFKYIPEDNNEKQDNNIYAGKKLNLVNVNLYVSSDATKATRAITGIYYLWDTNKIKNRYRITNSINRVGVSNQVTGWIDSKYV